MVQFRNICDCGTCSGAGGNDEGCHGTFVGGWACVCRCHFDDDYRREQIERRRREVADIIDSCVDKSIKNLLAKAARIFKVQLHDGSSYYASHSDLLNALDGDCDGAAFGTKWTLELVDMTEEQYQALPDFAGH
jgi:hypothetical protein